MKQDVFSLAERRSSFELADALRADSIEDLKSWLRIRERKMDRSLATSGPPPGESTQVESQKKTRPL
jgi:hypothetical protein